MVEHISGKCEKCRIKNCNQRDVDRKECEYFLPNFTEQNKRTVGEKYFVKYIVSTSDHEHEQGIEPKTCDVQTIQEAIYCSLNWELEPYQLTIQKVEATDEITTIGSLEEVMADVEVVLYAKWLEGQKAKEPK